MKKGNFKKKISAALLSLVLGVGALSSIPNGMLQVEASDDETVETQDTLNVALYEYVPDVERFEAAVEEKWAAVHPDISLNFVSWDSYDSDPADSLDVFVFDALFLSHFVEEGYLTPLGISQVQNANDILPFALDGCTIDGNIYAIPQIVCTNLLYSRKNDSGMAGVDTVDKLYNVIGNCTSTGVIPNDNEGLLIDMSGGTTKVCMYLDALIDVNQTYTDYYNLPDVNDLNSTALANLALLQSMAGKEQASYWPDNNDSYIRALWFKEGHGRAYIGYTEAMCSMGDFANDVDFRTISLANNPDIPLFYGDVVGVNSAITDQNKKGLAIELANIVASADTTIAAISPDENNLYPQYLLPARLSVYEYMQDNYPIYGKLEVIATNPNNKLFKVGPNVRSWIAAAKPVISAYLKSH